MQPVAGLMMAGQGVFWDFGDHLREFSAEGDPRKAGRPPFDAALKFKMLVLQALHGLSLQQTSYLVRDRLSWLRFCGLGLVTGCRTRIRCGISARR